MRSLFLTGVFLASFAPALAAERVELRPVDERESLTGTHIHYRQFVDDIEVVGGDAVVHLDKSGRELARRVSRMAMHAAPQPGTTPSAAAETVRLRFPHEVIERVEQVVYARAGKFDPAWRVISSESLIKRYLRYVDAESLEIIETIPLFYTVSARVFEANPVTVLNNPSLQDSNDSAAAVPEAAYVTRELLETAPTGPLTGPNISIVDLENPRTTRAEAAQPILFDRSDHRFEEAMAYYHLDQSQRYLQSLGFTGPRRVINRSLRVDAHGASGQDNSYYSIDSRGEGGLFFGDGGVDDAEDPDILLHEYGHAVHDAIAPSAFLGSAGSHGRAMGEGFGDYWAFSAGYAISVSSGRDPFCIGDWDARCALAGSTGCAYPPNADCLRRVDGSKTMDNYIVSDVGGTEHRNGEIWSSLLRQIFMTFVQRDGIENGRRNADRLIVESLFGMPANPTFRIATEKLLQSDQLLNGGINATLICTAAVARKIVSAAECGQRPRGEYTTHAAEGGAIPDNQPAPTVFTRHVDDDRVVESVQVRVDIAHPYRGDLQIALVAPNGRRVLLFTNGIDSGDDLHTTFGVDTQPVESLDVLRGIPARGEWRLEVSDHAAQDTGRLISWALLIRFAGDSALGVRPVAESPRIFLPVPTADADFRFANRGALPARITMLFTPTGSDGTNDFAAVVLSIAPGETARLDDVVPTHFRSAGSGAVEITGDLSNVMITGRAGGMTLRPLVESVSVGTGSLHILDTRASTLFESAIGVVEVGGGTGTVELIVRDGSGTAFFSTTFAIDRFGHREIRPTGGFAATGRAEVRILSGDAQIGAYAAVRDTSRSDGVLIPGETARARQIQIVPAVISAPGAGSVLWRTDLALSNLATVPQSVVLSLRSETTQSRTVTIPPGGTSLLQDVVSFVVGRAEAGSLSVSGSIPDGLLVTSRTYVTGGGAEHIAARPASESIGRRDPPVRAMIFEQSSAFRTNLGITEVSGNEVTVRVRVHDSDGTPVATVDQIIRAHGHLQFPLARMTSSPIGAGHASFEVIGGNGKILAYSSSVENQSGDSVYIPAN